MKGIFSSIRGKKSQSSMNETINENETLDFSFINLEDRIGSNKQSLEYSKKNIDNGDAIFSSYSPSSSSLHLDKKIQILDRSTVPSDSSLFSHQNKKEIALLSSSPSSSPLSNPLKDFPSKNSSVQSSNATISSSSSGSYLDFLVGSSSEPLIHSPSQRREDESSIGASKSTLISGNFSESIDFNPTRNKSSSSVKETQEEGRNPLEGKIIAFGNNPFSDLFMSSRLTHINDEESEDEMEEGDNPLEGRRVAFGAGSFVDCLITSLSSPDPKRSAKEENQYFYSESEEEDENSTPSSIHNFEFFQSRVPAREMS